MINKKLYIFVACTLSLGQVFSSNELSEDERARKVALDFLAKGHYSRAVFAKDYGEHIGKVLFGDKISSESNKDQKADSENSVKGSSGLDSLDDLGDTFANKSTKDQYAGYHMVKINIPGQEDFDVATTNVKSLGDLKSYLRMYNQNLVDSVKKNITNIDESIEQYRQNIQLLNDNDSAQFKNEAEKNLTEMNRLNFEALKLKSQIEQSINLVNSAYGIIENNLGLLGDSQKIVTAGSDINRIIAEIEGSRKNIQEIASKISLQNSSMDMELHLIAEKKAAEKLRAAQKAADEAKEKEEAAQKAADEAAKKAREQQTSVAKAAAAQAEANRKKTEQAVAQAEAKLQAAKKFAETKATMAKKLEIIFEQKKAKQVIDNTQNIVDKIQDLRNAIEYQAKKFDTLIEKIHLNSSMYQNAFIEEINNTIIPEAREWIERINEDIETANKIKNRLAELKEQMDKNEREYNALVGRGGDKISEKEILDKSKNLEKEFKPILVLANRSLQKMQEYHKELRKSYKDLVLSQQKAKIINSAEVARALELFREVKINDDAMKMEGEERRRASEREKEQKVARALDLFFVVKAEQNMKIAHFLELAYFVGKNEINKKPTEVATFEDRVDIR